MPGPEMVPLVVGRAEAVGVLVTVAVGGADEVDDDVDDVVVG